MLRLLPLMMMLPCLAQAQGVSARFSNQAATQGLPLRVDVEVEDPSGVVTRVMVEIRLENQATWTSTLAQPHEAGRWSAQFSATQLWPEGRAPAEVLELRALLYAKRGGLVMVLGEIEPFQMDALPPALAAARQQALGRAQVRTNPDEATGSTGSLAGYVGTEGRLGSSARARVFIAAGGPLSDTLELRGMVLVGPTFSEPRGRTGGGPVMLGFELGLRAYARPLGAAAWNLFAQPVVGLDVRLPGLDVLGGLRAGALYWIDKELAVEASLGGGLSLFGAISPEGETSAFGFTAGLQVGVRFGPERQ